MKSEADRHYLEGIWRDIYAETIRDLSNTSTQFVKKCKGTRKAHHVGIFATAGGIVVAGIGIICLPFSLGASMSIVGVGAAAALAGVGALGGATVTNYSNNSEEEKIADAALEVDRNLTTPVPANAREAFEKTSPINITKTTKPLSRLKRSGTILVFNHYIAQIQYEIEHRFKCLDVYEEDDWTIVSSAK